MNLLALYKAPLFRLYLSTNLAENLQLDIQTLRVQGNQEMKLGGSQIPWMILNLGHMLRSNVVASGGRTGDQFAGGRRAQIYLSEDRWTVFGWAGYIELRSRKEAWALLRALQKTLDQAHARVRCD